jgi:putative transposase
MVDEAMTDSKLSLNAAVKRIGQRVGIVPDTLRNWAKPPYRRRQAPGTTTADAERIKKLEQENRELKRANDPVGGQLVLRAGARPATAVVVAFIDDHRDRFGVEPICRVLSEHGITIAPSGYYAHRSRPPSDRSVRDQRVLAEIRRVHADPKLGRGLYGTRKVWHQLRREGGVDGHRVPRCQVERLMRVAGLQGVRRGRQVVTTKAEKAAARPPDLVDRDFTATRPNQLWVVDFTFDPTWSGTAFTAFVSDVYSRRIVGWRTADAMPTELPLDAPEMALWTRARAGHDVDGVIHHSDYAELCVKPRNRVLACAGGVV